MANLNFPGFPPVNGAGPVITEIPTGYTEGATYRVTGDDGVTRTGVYTGREQGAGVTFDVFRTGDRIPGQPGAVHVFLLVRP
jgi:hypothetical protein